MVPTSGQLIGTRGFHCLYLGQPLLEYVDDGLLLPCGKVATKQLKWYADRRFSDRIGVSFGGTYAGDHSLFASHGNRHESTCITNCMVFLSSSPQTQSFWFHYSRAYAV